MWNYYIEKWYIKVRSISNSNENKTSKKKRTLTKTVLIVALIMIFLFRYRDYIFNMISIKKHSLDTYDESYDTYTEYKIDESGKVSSSLEIIEFKEVRFNHVYGELEENNFHGERSFSKKNEDDIVIIIYPEDLERVDIAEYYEIPHHIRNYMVDAYGEDLFLDDYNLLKKAFEITPDDLSFFGKSRNKLVSSTVLFIIKSLEMPNIFEYIWCYWKSRYKLLYNDYW